LVGELLLDLDRLGEAAEPGAENDAELRRARGADRLHGVVDSLLETHGPHDRIGRFFMEENAKPRAGAHLISFLVTGVVAGFIGAFFGVLTTTHGGIFSLREKVVFTAMLGGPLVGLGVGYGLWMAQPRGAVSGGCVGWSLLLLAA